MAKKRTSKRIASINPCFENILVCNNKKLRPYVEIFVQEPENVAQENLGNLLGIFEISDSSEESSYIVNYLISTIKKEYFSRPKRGAIESFEAALHKANLALSSLAEHGNVKWIGKLNAIIASIEKNSLHLTQAGTTAAFLLRSKSMSEISEGLASEEPEPHPLKTFTNVASGRLEAGDKLIIATNEVFDIFSFEEIKKSAFRFSKEKFIQFLKTALGNELEKAAVLIADINEKEIADFPVPAGRGEEINAFSQDTFSKTRRAPETEEKLKEEISKVKEELPNKNNGHIYIREETEEREPPLDYWAEFQKKLRPAGIMMLQSAKNIFSFSRIKKINFSGIRPRFQALKSRFFKEREIVEKTDAAPAEVSAEKLQPAVSSQKKASSSLPAFDIGAIRMKVKIFGKKLFKAMAKILPSFNRIKNITSKLDYQQKIYAIIISLAIITVPLFAIKIQNSIKNKEAAAIPAPAAIQVPLENDKNIIRVSESNSILSDNNIIQTVNLNGKIFAAAESKIIALENNETFAMPEQFSPAVSAIAMDDLNFIFIFNKDNKVLYFSPVSKKFQENSLVVPENSQISAMATYLTYLYLADSQNNKIYRYPRAEGGFGEKADWLKDTVDLKNVSGMAIDENVYLANEETILKLFRGKKQEFNPEQSATQIRFDKIFTNIDTQNIYILDHSNSRIVKYSKTGELLSQYYNEKIKSALDLAVDEKNNKAYFAANNELFALELQ